MLTTLFNVFIIHGYLPNAFITYYAIIRIIESKIGDSRNVNSYRPIWTWHYQYIEGDFSY